LNPIGIIILGISMVLLYGKIGRYQIGLNNIVRW